MAVNLKTRRNNLDKYCRWHIFLECMPPIRFRSKIRLHATTAVVVPITKRFVPQHSQAMENSTKNAKEMLDGLTLLYNRTRQAVITKELIEIISGAEALNG